MLRAPDSYRARAVPSQGEATEGLRLPPQREPCPLASQRCPGRAGAGRVIPAVSMAAFVTPPAGPGTRRRVTGVLAGPGFQCAIR